MSYLDFLKVVRLVFWSGVVGPGTSFRSLALRARTIALRAHSRATRSKARLVSKSMSYCTVPPMAFTFAAELVVQATSA